VTYSSNALGTGDRGWQSAIEQVCLLGLKVGNEFFVVLGDKRHIHNLS